MINKALRDIVNLLIYGGAFIGLCAACLTALSLRINGKEDSFFMYTLWIGICTAALYSGHRVIGLKKMEHIKTSERFNVLRKYQNHIWIYFVIWIILSGILFLTFGTFQLLIWMLPGGFIAVGYVLPVILGKKRLRDLGWTKIIMIGWSWAWLTSFVPLYYLAKEPLFMVSVMTLERIFFIIAITIPFEIRDMQVDKSVGLMTLPEKFGKRNTTLLVWSLCIGIVLLSYVAAYHYFNDAYFITMVIISICILFIYRHSSKTQDTYFFGGLTDGLMILALLLHIGLNHFI